MPSENLLRFGRAGHFWQDCGLLGLWSMLKEVCQGDVKLSLDSEGLSLEGEPSSMESALMTAYDRLVSRYYDVSTQKQRDNKEGYNFYLDTKTETFVPFPKKKTYGIAQMVYDNPPSASASQVGWKKGKAGDLPDSLAHLQPSLDRFLDQQGLKPTGKNLLLDGPNEIRPKAELFIAEEGKKGKNVCALCGGRTSKAVDVKSTVFPLLGGNSAGLSFNPEGGKPDKSCWKCAFTGLFTPAVGLFRSSGGMLFAYFPFSSSMEALKEFLPSMKAMKDEDPNGYYNFDIRLGDYFSRESEMTLAFLHHLYVTLKNHRGEDDPLEIDELLDLVSSHGDLGFYVLAADPHTQPKGIKSLWPFTDTRWIFRLFDRLEKEGKDLKKVMALLVDWDAKKDKTLIRDRICRAMLNGRSILETTERLVYHLFGGKDRAYLAPLVDFVVFYEKNGRRTVGMKDEHREAAVRLGKRIGSIAGSNDREKGEKRGRSCLYSLRRSRSMVTFMEQLNRLQFRMAGGLVIPPDIYGGALSEANFQEFKQYCMICALNSYFAAQSSKQGDNTQEVL